MTTAWLDLSCGASGEMVLGALVDAGVPLEVVAEAALPLALQRVPARRGGLSATWVLPSTTTPLPGDSTVVEQALEAAIRAGLAWLREQGQLTSLSAWPTNEAPLVQSLVDTWEQPPADLIGLTGLGAGSTEVSDHPHVVKLVLTS